MSHVACRVVYVSVCLYVCVLGLWVSCANRLIHVGLRNHSLDGGPDSPREGSLLTRTCKFLPAIVKYRDYVVWMSCAWVHCALYTCCHGRMCLPSARGGRMHLPLQGMKRQRGADAVFCPGQFLITSFYRFYRLIRLAIKSRLINRLQLLFVRT